MNTATQPTAAQPTWPLRLPSPDGESQASFWPVIWLSEQLEAECISQMWKQDRFSDLEKSTLIRGAAHLRNTANRSLQWAIEAGALLFCWEGSSVMHTPIPAAQP